MVVLLAPQSTSLSGGYLYNQHLAAELPADRFMYLQLQHRRRDNMPPQPQELTGLGVPPDATLLIDSLYFSFPEWVGALDREHRGELAMMVHYLPSLNPTVTPDSADTLRRAELRCLNCCGRIIVPSTYMKMEIQRLLGLQSPPDEPQAAPRRRDPARPARPAIHTAPPGTDPATPAHEQSGYDRGGQGTSSGGPAGLQLLTVANWTAAKNHRFLLPLLAEFRELNWIWRIFGQADEHETLVEEFRHTAEHLGISGRIRIEPQISPGEVAHHMQAADVFLYPSLFESYGMVVAEALAAGLPVVANSTGGIPEVAGPGEAVLLCSGPTPTALSEAWHHALQSVLTDREYRAQLSRAAVARARTLPAWPDTAAAVLTALEKDK